MISVLLATYNWPQALSLCLQGLREQTNKNFEIIICDEVTSALDQIVQEGILKLLLNLQKDYNITYLFITHDIAVVNAISDEIVVMYQGAVIEQGLKSEIMSPPHPEYTQLLLNSVPEMDPDWLTKLVKSR